MVFSNPLSFSFAIPNVNEKHKHKIIVINRSYTIINICLISDILQKYNHFLAEMLGDSIFFRTFAPFLKQYESNNLTYQYHEEDQFFERNARCSNFIYC